MSKIIKVLNTKTAAVAVVGVVGVIAIYYAQKKALEAAENVGEAINPLNDNNVFASGVDGVGSKLTGKNNFKLGECDL